MGRFTCLLAILTIPGGTIFGVASASGRGDSSHAGAGTTTVQSNPGQSGRGTPGSTGDGRGGVAPGSTGAVTPPAVTPPTAGGPGDHHGPPSTGGGAGDGQGGGSGSGSPSGGQGDGQRGGSGTGNPGGGDAHGGPSTTGGPPMVVGPPAIKAGDPPPTGGDGTGGPPPTGGDGTGGPSPTGGHAPDDGHDHGTHLSSHPTPSVAHAQDAHSGGTPVATTPVLPVTASGGAGVPKTRPPKTTFSFTPGNPSPVRVTPSPNPTATGAGLGSAPGATGATTQAAAAAGGLGLLAPATSDVGVRSGGGSASGQGSGPATSPFGGSRAALRALESSGVGPGAILTLLPYIPTVVWIALGASILLAAATSGVAFLNGRRASREHAQRERVEAVAKTDPLTGVLNRRGFTEAVERELARARRHGRQFVLAYVDVRGLKAVNDTEGHLAGDELLKGVATLLTESARADDVVGRIGGDELGLLLVEQTGDSAAAVTRRIEAQVSARRSDLGLRTQWGLTVGTSAFPEDGDTFDDLVAAADRRLYEQRGIALSDGRV